MKPKFLHFYYIFMISMLAFYTNMSQSPNLIIRMGYLVVLILPLINRIALFPAVIICTLAISKNTFAYPLMPTEMYYYILITVGFGVLSLKKRKGESTINVLFLFILLYVVLNDIIMQGHLSNLATSLLLFIMFYFCSESDIETSNKYLPISFLILTLVLNYWILFCDEARIITYNKAAGMEQIGWTDPNYLGCSLGIGLVIAVNALLQKPKKQLYLFVLILIVVGSIMALLNIASRGMILAASVSIVMLVFFSRVKRWTKISIIVLLALLIALLYFNQYFVLLIARFNADDGTGSNRTTIWISKLIAFFNEGTFVNWLFGFGQKGGLKLHTYSSTHNDYVSALVYYGFFGVFLFIFAIIYPLMKCSKQDRPQITALLVYLLLCSMTIEPLASGSISYMGLYFYIALLARNSRYKQQI